MRVAVNLSPVQFRGGNVCEIVREALSKSGLSPNRLELEITESSLMVNPEEATRTLEYLKSLGVGISIDDFGTGYSSLGYLKRFPLDSLKVDRSFVRDVTTDADDPSLVSIFVTLPTATPAVRTGELTARLFAFAKTAFSSYGLLHGYLCTNAA